MQKKLLFLVVLISIGLIGFAQQVVIKGNAKSYMGDVLQLKCYDDLVSYKEKELASCIVDNKGNFSFKCQISETMMSFIHLNVFKGILFIEPGKQYEIVLPQKVVKLAEDELNPFFKENEFSIRVLNAKETDLNELVSKFDNQYNFYLNKYFYLFRGKLSKTLTDSIINAIDKSFPAVENHFFKDYKNYNYISLRLMAYERNKDTLIGNTFFQKPILYQNPAYMNLFNQLFSNYLAYYSQSKKGEKIPYFLIKEKSLKNVKMVLSEDSILQDDNLQDLIIAKSLFENFYKEDFPKESIIFVLDSLKNFAKSKENRIIASNIYEKITELLLLYPVPDFELPDKNGKIHSIANSSGKFVYLNFLNPKSYTCQQELDVLKKMAERNYEMFDIISVCVCSNIEEFKNFLKDKEYNWTFLYLKDLDLLKKYDVRAYPTYYLINPEGKLAMSPAFPPTEPSLEARYFDILKAWKKEIDLRKAKKGVQH